MVASFSQQAIMSSKGPSSRSSVSTRSSSHRRRGHRITVDGSKASLKKNQGGGGGGGHQQKEKAIVEAASEIAQLKANEQKMVVVKKSDVVGSSALTFKYERIGFSLQCIFTIESSTYEDKLIRPVPAKQAPPSFGSPYVWSALYRDGSTMRLYRVTRPSSTTTGSSSSGHDDDDIIAGGEISVEGVVGGDHDQDLKEIKVTPWLFDPCNDMVKGGDHKTRTSKRIKWILAGDLIAVNTLVVPEDKVGSLWLLLTKKLGLQASTGVAGGNYEECWEEVRQLYYLYWQRAHPTLLGTLEISSPAAADDDNKEKPMPPSLALFSDPVFPQFKLYSVYLEHE